MVHPFLPQTSLKYHQLYPDYIHERVRSIRNQEGAFSLLVLLCLVDIHVRKIPLHLLQVQKGRRQKDMWAIFVN